MILKSITPPTHEPVTLTDVEGQCRIGSLSDEAATVELFIPAVRQRAETITRRALITQVHELVLDAFPVSVGYRNIERAITIPLPPLQSVESIKYIDTNGAEQTLDPALYRVDSDSEPARVVPAYGTSWPSTRNEIATVRVRFACGYGPTDTDTADNVPSAIKQWILLNVANLYENRETLMIDRNALVDMSTLADSLIQDYRVISW